MKSSLGRAVPVAAALTISLFGHCAVAACVANQTAAYDPTRTTLARITGRVFDSASGEPVIGASVSVRNTTVCSNATGFLMHSLLKRNALLTVRHPDYYTEVIPVQLNVTGDNTLVTLAPVAMTARRADSGLARMLFGGDVALGRRYLDPAADQFYPRTVVPPDNPAALIQSSNPEPGTAAVLAAMRELFAREAADFRVVNLESPVLLNPATPHTAKDHAFFTLPGSLNALVNLGIDYVSLGNNHAYDYLQQGMGDTLSFVSAAGLKHSGAGRDRAEAFRAHRHGTYSLLSFSSLSGNQFGAAELTLHASDSKGGSANLADRARVATAITSERVAGFAPIAQLHTGREYTYLPSAFASARMRDAAAAGAALVVSHHPHVAQGFGFHLGVPIIHSLGNLAFDSDRLETLLGLLVYADFQGARVTRLSGVPIYIEDYQPKPLTGDLANRLIRRIGEFSWPGTIVYPENSRAVVALDPAGVVHASRTVTCVLAIDASGTGVMDLRSDPESPCRLRSEESLQSLEVIAGSPDTVQVGRDMMVFGEMEDFDVDGDHREATEWYLEPTSVKVCASAAHTGTGGICSARTEGRITDSVLKFRKRARVMGDADDAPNKDLSVIGYVQGDNAGALSLRVTYGASELDRTFGEQVFALPAGSFPWARIVKDLDMPADNDPSLVVDPKLENARAVVLTLRHSAPAAGTGIARYDDFAIVNWEAPLSATPAAGFRTPNVLEYVRIRGLPGTYQVRVTFASTRSR